VDSFADALRTRTVVIDGGLATELERRGHDLTSALWSARLLMDDPDAIRDVHRAYFDGGAEVATAASYQASFEGFDRVGADGALLMRRSVALARQARDEHGGGWVAASVGPYGAVLADGSEYHGDYGLSVAQLRAFHRPRLEELAAAEPDLLAVETIPCLAEVEALLAELERIDVPAWFSVTATDTETRAGEPVAEAFVMATDGPSVVAVGVNCVAPGDVAELARIAAGVGGKPVIAYPNSGETWDASSRSWTGQSRFHTTDVLEWLSVGVRAVGGCCRVGPSGIAGLAELVGRAG